MHFKWTFELAAAGRLFWGASAPVHASEHSLSFSCIAIYQTSTLSYLKSSGALPKVFGRAQAAHNFIKAIRLTKPRYQVESSAAARQAAGTSEVTCSRFKAAIRPKAAVTIEATNSTYISCSATYSTRSIKQRLSIISSTRRVKATHSLNQDQLY